jgi:pyruvate formate lyase activating enzyme
VHSIESCGVFDGPGIRTVIFLQGCKLRCLYCHNPDTWALTGRGEEMDIPALLEKLSQFKPFMKSSQGGVTVSGGEPLLQKKFLLAFFKVLKAEGFHTCIDTNGMVQLDDVTHELMDVTDLFLMDIKHIDSKKHQELVGKDNKLPLAFLDALDQSQQNVWIRYVIVPGLTDDPSDVEELARHLSQYSCIQQIDLLPYHKMGSYKYDEMNLKYRLKEMEPPSTEVVQRIAETFKSYDFNVTV